MTILEDSRQQKDKHEIKHKGFADQRVKLCRNKLVVGDYCLPPRTAVDTKASISEIAQNIGGGRDEHQRFIRELKLAQGLDCKLYVLIENTEGVEDIDGLNSWRNPRTDYSPDCIQGPRLAKAMHTIESRYGCTFMFCTPEEAADIIVDLLREEKA